jgi:hypothetical protein
MSTNWNVKLKIIFVLNLVFCVGMSALPASAVETAPIINTITAGNTYLEVDFTAASGTPSFYQYSINNGSSWVTPSIPVSSTPLTIHNLVNGTSYAVKIRPVYSGTLGASSVAVSATPASATQGNSSVAFLQGAYAEVGVLGNGAFGSTSVPVGFHPSSNQPENACLGFRVDRLKNGWKPSSTTDDGDFFCPGTSYEGWGISFAGTEYRNISTGYVADDITGVISNITNGADGQSATWTKTSGGPSDLGITKTYTVPNQGQEILLQVTLRNNGSSTMSNIFYSRAVDPDNQAMEPGASSPAIYYSQNVINRQGGTSQGAAVTSTFPNGGNLTLFSDNINARVALNADCCGIRPIIGGDIWNQTGNWNVASPFEYDSDIGLAVKIPTLEPSDSISFTIRYYLTSEAASQVIPTAPTPEFGNIVSAANGFQVAISNFDNTFLYTLIASAGNATLDQVTGVVSVTGLAAGESSTLTVITSKNNFNDSTGSVIGSALIPGQYSIQYSGPNSLNYKVTAQVINYDDSFTWSVSASSGQATINATGLVSVHGIRVDQEISITITAAKNGYITSVIILGRSLVAPMIPNGAPKLTVENGSITCSIGLYSAQPTSTIFSIWVDGAHKFTKFSNVGDFLPDWLVPWATSETITRDSALASASWVIPDDWKGKSVACSTIAYAKSATGSILSLPVKLG